MRKLFLTILTLSIFSFSHELPICEEYESEPNIKCISSDKQAVIITTHLDGSRTYEYFSNNKKIYLEYGENYVLASNGIKTLNVSPIPTEKDDIDRYITEVYELMFRGF